YCKDNFFLKRDPFYDMCVIKIKYKISLNPWIIKYLKTLLE
ncbi:unnamed protein product, partial [marine sediment metagenome]